MKPPKNWPTEEQLLNAACQDAARVGDPSYTVQVLGVSTQSVKGFRSSKFIQGEEEEEIIVV